MSEQTPVLESTDLAARFPECVVADERKGFSGYIVNAENLIEVATYIRDELGYDYLSSVTGVITCLKARWKWSTMPSSPPEARPLSSKPRRPGKTRRCRL